MLLYKPLLLSKNPSHHTIILPSIKRRMFKQKMLTIICFSKIHSLSDANGSAQKKINNKQRRHPQEI